MYYDMNMLECGSIEGRLRAKFLNPGVGILYTFDPEGVRLTNQTTASGQLARKLREKLRTLI